jgi:hypothetical protein
MTLEHAAAYLLSTTPQVLCAHDCMQRQNMAAYNKFTQFLVFLRYCDMKQPLIVRLIVGVLIVLVVQAQYEEIDEKEYEGSI